MRNKSTMTIEAAITLLLVIFVVIALISYSPKIWDLIRAGIGFVKQDTSNINEKIPITEKNEIIEDNSPSPARNVRAVYYGNKVIVSWLKSLSNNIESYAVIRDEEGKPPVNVCEIPSDNKEVFTCTDDRGDLKIGTKYIYTVTTYDSNGLYADVIQEVIPSR